MLRACVSSQVFVVFDPHSSLLPFRLPFPFLLDVPPPRPETRRLTQLFLVMWKRRSNTLAFRWGVHKEGERAGGKG